MSLAPKVAAIEFAGDEVRLAVVKAAGRAPKVMELHVCRAEYSDPAQRSEALAQALGTVIKRMKNRPAAYVLCMSSGYSVVRTLTIPFRGARKVAAAVPFEIEPYLAFPIEELAVDFTTVLELEGQTDVLAVGVRGSVLREQLALLETAGIHPEGIDIDATGLTGLWRVVNPSMKGLNAVLHVRDDGAVLAVVHNKTLAYFRYLSLAAAEIRRNPVAAAREVQNSIRAFQVGWRGAGEVASLAVTGMGLGEAERETFEREVDIPVSYEDLLVKVKASHLAREALRRTGMEEPAGSAEEVAVAAERSNCWEAVIGVAAGAAGKGFSLNFRKGDLAYGNVVQGVLPHLVIASCLAVLLLVGLAGYYHAARVRNLAEADRLREKIQLVEAEVLDLQGQGVNVSAATFSDPSLLDILNEIGAKMPDEKVTITDLRIDHADAHSAWITIRGQVKDDSVFSMVMKELKQSTVFQVDEPELKLGEGRSTFKIVARKKK
jgi:hypothetical protein